jgi:RNA polymerase sigma-70 factor, ECF subfamily
VQDSCAVAALDRTAALVPAPLDVALDVAGAFREHYPFVLRVLIGLGVPALDADDVAQDVFVVAHRRRAAFDGRRSLRGWLYGIARKLAQNRRRRRRLDGTGALPAATTGDPERAAAEAEALLIALRCLDRMSARLRETFVLAELEGLEAPVIAELLALPLNTVYSRLRLARARFEAALIELRAKEGRGRHAT